MKVLECLSTLKGLLPLLFIDLRGDYFRDENLGGDALLGV